MFCFFFHGPFLRIQSLFVSRERRRANAAGALSARRAYGPRHPETRPSDQHSRARRSRVCRHHQQSHQVRLHRWQGLRQGVGHQPTRFEVTCISTRLFGTYAPRGVASCVEATRTPPTTILSFFITIQTFPEIKPILYSFLLRIFSSRKSGQPIAPRFHPSLPILNRVFSYLHRMLPSSPNNLVSIRVFLSIFVSPVVSTISSYCSCSQHVFLQCNYVCLLLPFFLSFLRKEDR